MTGATLKVLVIDDEPPIRKLLRMGLATQGYEITEAPSGKVALESSAEYGEPVIIETIGAGDLLGWSWMMPPYQWHFTARALEPTNAIFFAAAILRQYCEKDHLLGFELHKRISAVMMKRLQAARKKMIAIHAQKEKLSPVPNKLHHTS